MNFLQIQQLVDLRTRFGIPTEIKKLKINDQFKLMIGKYNLPYFLDTDELETTAAKFEYDVNSKIIRKVVDVTVPTTDATVDKFGRSIAFNEKYDKAGFKSSTNLDGHIIVFEKDPGLRTKADNSQLTRHFYRHPVDMVENVDVPEFPENGHELIVLHAAAYFQRIKYGNSPLERELEDLEELTIGNIQKEPDPDFPDIPSPYDPRGVTFRKKIFVQEC